MHDIEIKYIGDLRTEARHLGSGSVIATDAPIDNHGKGQNFSPTDLLATSLGACMLTIMGIYARSKGIDISNTKVTVNKEMGTNPRKISAIDMKIIFGVFIEEKNKKFLEKVAHHCPVSKSIHPDIKESVEFIYLRD